MFASQDGLCAYCAADLTAGYHVEHIVPFSRGGGYEPENLCLTCPPCNLSKNNSTIVEWRVRRPGAAPCLP
jgi:5-methylcytosine-specific restriction endonuclease McrA